MEARIKDLKEDNDRTNINILIFVLSLDILYFNNKIYY